MESFLKLLRVLWFDEDWSSLNTLEWVWVFLIRDVKIEY
jgi:hypothetical protein